jgi:hypothetical protein
MKQWLVALAVVCVGCGNSDYDVAVRNGAKKLSKAEAQAALADHTLLGAIPHLNIDFTLYYAADGRLIGAITGSVKGRDRGVWRVQGDGRVCLKWSSWEEGDEKCRELWRDGEELKIFDDKNGRAVSVARSKSGNTQKLEVRSDLEIVQAKEPLEPVRAAELRSMLAGNTVSGRTAKGDDQHTFYGPDNRLWVSIPEDVIKDKGTYRIDDSGKVCATWGYLHGTHERCESWYKTAKGYSVFDPYGTLALIAKVQPGNPEKLGQ